MSVKLLNYVKVIDQNHEHFGRVGQLTDFDTVDKEFILYFDKVTDTGHIYWDDDSTRVKTDQVERSRRAELERK